ncbi:MAG TPA: VOC family protein [Thermoanaerobaculia bacterium]
MRATVSHFEIPAHDLDRAARFYQEIFAWRIDRAPWTTPYYKVRGAAGESPGREGIDGGLLPAGGGVDYPLLVIHLSGAALEQCLERIVRAGGEVDLPPEAVGAMGRFARFRDPEGNLLGLWEPI